MKLSGPQFPSYIVRIMALVSLLSSQADEKRVMWAISEGEWDGLAGKGDARGERQGSLTLPEARPPHSPWQAGQAGTAGLGKDECVCVCV